MKTGRVISINSRFWLVLCSCICGDANLKSQNQEDRKLYPCLTFKKLFKVESCQFNLKNTSNNQNFLQKMYLMPCYSYCPGDLVAHMGEQEIRSVFKRLRIIQENWYRCNWVLILLVSNFFFQNISFFSNYMSIKPTIAVFLLFVKLIESNIVSKIENICKIQGTHK